MTGSMRVLVVDDDTRIREVLRRQLSYEGYQVSLAADAREAFAQVAENPPDLVVLDWMLPGMSGLEICRRIRQTDDMPILMLTAKGTLDDKVDGLDSGADDYLCKPFAFAELLARIRSLSRRQDRRGSTLLSFEDVSVDLASQRVERNGKRIDLTVKEQSLLIYLLRNVGKVLSRTSIYEHVWNEQYDGTSNTLEVHIMELRRKLELYGPRLIFTVRGRGYTLSEKAQAE